jgi:prepilin-type N-terminal cleavage/methylation domain-containing protein
MVTHARQHSGFSLIELLTVMVIIALVVAIVIPTLGRARDSARSTSTQSFVQRFVQAAEQFQQDHRRMPGYFTVREMGAAQNINRGLSAVQNMLLDLSGGVVTSNPAPPGTVSGVGPLDNPQTHIRVAPDMIGVPSASNKAYFTPSAKNMALLSQPDQRVSIDEHARLPELVDDYGMPLIAWVQDDAGQASVRRPEDFAAEDSRTPSRFYWASNAAILRAPATGRLKVNMSTQSLLGATGTAPSTNTMRSLRGLLGNPAYPVDVNPAVDQILPSTARGPLVVMSTGRNGVFLGIEERGAKAAAGPLDYGLNFKSRAGNVLNPRVDILAEFDDIVVAGGN